ncbi:hypothetical protein KIW84_063906 [Lathyrus oleraceus]|uniref:Myosin N-terminal SH3-like domain-containing protein n=1 Tax=Pisum sativum TaxID=3888 RepID=A0A9D4WBA7_PEA|nr:hypothetical protein KIW84_063906 [Pisum sativum]
MILHLHLQGTPENIIVGSHVWIEDPEVAWIDGQVLKINGKDAEIETSDGKKSQSVRMYLRGRGKIDYITGDKKQPDKACADYDIWDAENSMVMTWLVNSMDEEIGANYLYYDTAKELWEGQDLDLFNECEWIPPADSKHYKKMVDVSRVFKFLASLNVDFDEVRGRILGRNPIPPIGEVFSEVRREESRRQVMLGKNTAAAPPPVEGSALAIPHVNRKPLPNQ